MAADEFECGGSAQGVGLAESKNYAPPKLHKRAVGQRSDRRNRLAIKPQWSQRLNEVAFAVAANPRVPARNVAEDRHVDSAAGYGLAEDDAIVFAHQEPTHSVNPQQETPLG